MNVWLVYVRQSYKRASDADVSEEQQEAAARRLIPAGAVVEVIADAGGHNSGATANRDGYRQLLRRIEDPDVKGVAVYDLSRLARNARLMLELKARLDSRNLHLVVSNLPDSRFDSATGRYLFGQLVLAAQFQRDLDSERMAGLARTKYQSGGHNGLDPFGYRTVRDELGRIARPHRLEVVEDEAELVRMVFDTYASDAGRSCGAVAARLNAEGRRRRVLARGPDGLPADVERAWTEKGIADILRRAPFYTGHATHGRDARRELRPGTHPPIISPEQAQLVERAKHRRHRPGRPDAHAGPTCSRGSSTAGAGCGCGARRSRGPAGPTTGTTGARGGVTGGARRPTRRLRPSRSAWSSTSPATPPRPGSSPRCARSYAGCGTCPTRGPGTGAPGSRPRRSGCATRGSGATLRRLSTGPSGARSTASSPTCRRRPTPT